MSPRRLDRLLWMILILFPVCALGEGKGGAERAEVKEVREDVYSILQSGKPAGEERFSWIVYDNNTSVIESALFKYFTGSDTFKEMSTLVIEDDSRFPLSYKSKKIAAEHVMKIEMEMFANVARFRTDNNGRKSEITRVFPTGALCVQLSTPSHLSLLLGRYDEARGGGQAVVIFDPVSKKEASVVLEKVGKEKVDVGGEERELTLYKARRAVGGDILLYVDDSGTAVKIVDTLQRTEYRLRSQSGG